MQPWNTFAEQKGKCSGVTLKRVPVYHDIVHINTVTGAEYEYKFKPTKHTPYLAMAFSTNLNKLIRASYTICIPPPGCAL